MSASAHLAGSPKAEPKRPNILRKAILEVWSEKGAEVAPGVSGDRVAAQVSIGGYVSMVWDCIQSCGLSRGDALFTEAHLL